MSMTSHNNIRRQWAESSIQVPFLRYTASKLSVGMDKEGKGLVEYLCEKRPALMTLAFIFSN